MKPFWISIVLIFTTLIGYSQTDTGFKYLENNEFELALAAFEVDANHKTKKAASQYGIAKVYLDTSYTGFNPDIAWEKYLECNESLKAINYKKKQKYLEKYNIKMSRLKTDISSLAFSLAEKKNTSSAFDDYLFKYQKTAKKFKTKATKARNIAAWNETLSLNTFEGFKSFISKYEKSLSFRNPDILKKSKLKLFESFIAENGWSEIPTFEKKHPDNPYIIDDGISSFLKIESSDAIEDFRTFLDDYSDSHFKKYVLDRIAVLVNETGTINDLSWFLFSFTNHPMNDKIWRNFLKLYLVENGENSIVEFANTFPQYPFMDELENDIAKILEEEQKEIVESLKNGNDVFAIIDFLESNPKSPKAEALHQQVIPILLENPSIDSYAKYFLLNPDPDVMTQLLNKLYDIYSYDLNEKDISSFMENWGSALLDTTHVANDRRLAKEKIKLKLNDKWNDFKTESIHQFIIEAAPNYAAFQALQYLISNDIKYKNWTDAKSKVEKYKSNFNNTSTFYNQLSDALNAETQNIKITNLGTSINTFASEYSPVISADGKTLYFCGKKRKDNIGREDIYFSKKINNRWTQSQLLNGINTVIQSEAPEAISVDGTQMLLFKGGKLSFRNKTMSGWSEMDFLPRIINQTNWQADASISSDGNVLIFASQRDHVIGMSNRVNHDIYVALKNENGEWSKVFNLGADVNTPMIDRSPYLHPDMKTLYFSSSGHGGFGGMDVFKTTRLDDTWTNWSTPINLGKGINTIDSDWGYKVSTDGSTAYFSSAEGGINEDIFQIELPKAMRPEKVSTLAGVLLGSQNQPIEADIVIEDLDTGNKIAELKSNPQTGEFFVVLPEKKKYSYYVKKENYYPISNNIDLRNNSNNTITEDLRMYSLNELSNKGVVITLENIFFETNKYELQTSSFAELNRLAKLISENDFKVTLTGHTDNVGLDNNNITLSSNRANAVKKYLIKKGIAESKINTIGLGESQPIDTNETKEGRAKNRRVEIKFSN